MENSTLFEKETLNPVSLSGEPLEIVTSGNTENVSQGNDTSLNNKQDISISDIMSVVYFIMSSVGK